MNPIAMPCRARPASIGASESDSAQVTEPTSRMAALVASTRCLPNRSASRPATGIDTAAASRVTVTTQPALDGRRVQQQRELALDRDDERLGEGGAQAAEAEDDHGAQRAGRRECWRGHGAMLEMIALVNQFRPHVAMRMYPPDGLSPDVGDSRGWSAT